MQSLKRHSAHPCTASPRTSGHGFGLSSRSRTATCAAFWWYLARPGTKHALHSADPTTWFFKTAQRCFGDAGTRCQ